MFEVHGDFFPSRHLMTITANGIVAIGPGWTGDREAYYRYYVIE